MYVCMYVCMSWLHDFLHLSPVCLSFPKQVYLYGVLTPLKRVACLGRMILTVSPGLRPQSVGAGWSHDFPHLSPICLLFVPHLCPTLGPVGRMISLTCLPFVFHLSPTLGRVA